MSLPSISASPVLADVPVKVRAKALYVLVKELGLPDEYLEAMQYLIEETDYLLERAEKAERKAAQLLQYAMDAIRHLEQIQRHTANPLIQPTPSQTAQVERSKPRQDGYFYEWIK